MKVEPVALSLGQNTQVAATPLITADDIKSILYLGIKGEIKLDAGRKHAVDTYA